MSKLVQKNDVTWRDIVKIGDDYYEEEFTVSFEEEILNEVIFGNSENEILEKLEELEEEYGIDNEPLYNCSNFFEEVRKKYNLDEDADVETYLFDGIELPEEVCEKYDIAWLGGYINGMNI